MELPSNAAIRIVENPHSMRHVPQNLCDIVAYNRREAVLCSLQQISYARRRERWDLERLQRIALSQDTFQWDDSDDEYVPARVIVHRRRSSVIDLGYRQQLPSKEELILKPRIA